MASAEGQAAGAPAPAKEQVVTPSEAETDGEVGGEEATAQVVTPWEVEADGDEGIDYTALVMNFGSQLITEELLARMEKVTGKRVHHWLRKEIFFSHRDLNTMLDLYVGFACSLLVVDGLTWPL